jgi:Family of unknown function (DUF6256)
MAEPAEEIWRRIVPPLVAAFVVFLAMLRVASRPGPAHPSPRRDVTWPRFLRYLLLTAAGGYIAMLAIVLVFHVVLASDRGALRSAAAGGAALLAIALPVFVLAEWLERRARR